jgi:hypothetical protein
MLNARMTHIRLALGVGTALLFVPLTIPLLMRRVFALDDLSAMHLPLRHLYQQALRSGHFPLWTPALGGGTYLLGEGQAGIAHPFHLALYGLLPLDVAFNLELIASYVLAFAGMWLLLRRLGLADAGAWCGSIAFAFCGFNLLHFLHPNMVAIVAHMPWLLWAADLALAGDTPRRRAAGAAAIALTLASAILIGFPQSVWFALVALAWFVVFRIVRGAPLGRVALVAAAVACGALIGAVQLLPTLDLLRESFRSDTTDTFRVSFSLHPLNLVQFVSGYTFATRVYTPVHGENNLHELGVYDGAFAVFVAAWILARWRHLTHRPLAGAFLALAGAGLVLALGRYGVVYPLLSQVPGLAGFRAPVRHIVLVHFALAGLAAIVLDDLVDLARRRAPLTRGTTWAIAVPAALSVAAVALTLGLSGSGAGDALGLRGVKAALGAIPFVLTAGLLAAAARGAKPALPLVVLVFAIDLGWWGHAYVWSDRPVAIDRIAPPEGLPPAAAGDLLHPFNDNRHVNVPVLFGYRSTRSYLGLYREPALTLYDPQVWRLLGVAWVLARERWIAIDDTLPQARLVADWRVTADPGADIREIDVARTALVDAPPGQTSGDPGTAAIVSDAPGALTVRTTAAGPQLLVVAQRFHEGWTARVDDAQVPVRRAYGDLLACLVPAGTHVVSWSFEPASAAWGLRLTLLGLLATALLWAAAARAPV